MVPGTPRSGDGPTAVRTALTMVLLLAACGGGSGDRAPPARAPEPVPVRDEGYEHALRGEDAFEEGRLDEAYAAYVRALELWPPRHPYRALVAYKLAWTCYRLD